MPSSIYGFSPSPSAYPADSIGNAKASSAARDGLDSPVEDCDDAGAGAYRVNTGNAQNMTNSNQNDAIMDEGSIVEPGN